MYVVKLTNLDDPDKKFFELVQEVSPEDSAPPIINHFNLNRTILIQGTTAPGKSSNGGLQQLVRSFQKLTLPNLGMAFSSLSRSPRTFESLASCLASSTNTNLARQCPTRYPTWSGGLVM